ncbi:TTR-31 protein [Aphelenchoides avenae]|nr:TTR-31 protein [Aphelenchus avenae]
MSALKVALILALHCLVTSALPNPFGSVQSAAVKGKLLCNGKPYFNAKLKLYDVDTFPDVDDLMAEGKSDHKGEFRLSGNETELTTIDPKLNIYHNCNDEEKECLRKIQIELPDAFVTQGPVPAKTFDAGILNLSGKFPGETRDCVN